MILSFTRSPLEGAQSARLCSRYRPGEADPAHSREGRPGAWFECGGARDKNKTIDADRPGSVSAPVPRSRLDRARRDGRRCIAPSTRCSIVRLRQAACGAVRRATRTCEKRFRREALAAARLSGEPNTVTIFDVGEWRGTPFIVMEYLGGGTLEQVLRDGAQRSGAERFAGSSTRHARSTPPTRTGVVHRDVKPANLLLDESGRVRVGDFGIATAAGLDSLTLTGTVLGTVGYLAPEQAQGRTITAGNRRIRARSSSPSSSYRAAAVRPRLGDRRGSGPLPTSRSRRRCGKPALPDAVDAVFARALAKDPSARFPSCAAFATALAAAWTHSPSAQTRPLVAPDLPTELTRATRRRSSTIAGAGLAFLAASGAAGLVLAHTLRSSHATVASTVVQTTGRQPPTPTAARAAPAAASDLNTRGYRLMLAGDYTGALPLLQLAVAGLEDPKDLVTAYANFNLGQTLVRLDRCDAALPYLRQAALLEPSRSEVGAALAFAELCAGDARGTVDPGRQHRRARPRPRARPRSRPRPRPGRSAGLTVTGPAPSRRRRARGSRAAARTSASRAREPAGARLRPSRRRAPGGSPRARPDCGRRAGRAPRRPAPTRPGRNVRREAFATDSMYGHVGSAVDDVVERVIRAHPVRHQRAPVAAGLARPELLRQPGEALLARVELGQRRRRQLRRGDLGDERLELCANEERLLELGVRRACGRERRDSGRTTRARGQRAAGAPRAPASARRRTALTAAPDEGPIPARAHPRRSLLR